MTDDKYCPPPADLGYLDPEITTVTNPFDHIALALSGGGYRASTFALGVLSYLENVEYDKESTLLDHVTYLSSTSGGTIISSTYALAIANNMPFNKYYKELMDRMTGTELLEKAMAILNDPDPWKTRPGKERNIINSFALAYDHLLLDKQKVVALKSNPDSHLEEVCFNTTEFYSGLLFRQSVKMQPDHNPKDARYFLFGNYKINLDHQTAEELHLSDMLAASSCFPAGFEPIVFPNDFVDEQTSKQRILNGLNITIEQYSWPELYQIYGKKEVNKLYESMPEPFDPTLFYEKLKALPVRSDFYTVFMDGGITDNQGIESMVQANKRRAAKTTDFSEFDLMLVCDVDTKWLSPYELPEKSTSGKFWNIRRILTLLWILAVVFTGTLGYSIGRLFHCPTYVFSTIGIVLSLCLLLPIGILLYKIHALKKQLISGGIGLDKLFSYNIRKLIFRFFAKIRMPKLVFMITSRLTSLVKISNDIFMSRIRYLLYQQFFNEGGLRRTGRVKSNHLYDLSFANDKDREQQYNQKYFPSTAMQIVAEYAKDMPTTLWFSKDGKHRKMQAAITASGQFTTCYNLLDYIVKLHCPFNGNKPIFEGLSLEQQALVNTIEAQLAADFAKFEKDPFWLYNMLGHTTNVSKFVAVDHNDQFKFPEEYFKLRKQ